MVCVNVVHWISVSHFSFSLLTTQSSVTLHVQHVTHVSCIVSSSHTLMSVRLELDTKPTCPSGSDLNTHSQHQDGSCLQGDIWASYPAHPGQIYHPVSSCRGSNHRPSDCSLLLGGRLDKEWLKSIIKWVTVDFPSSSSLNGRPGIRCNDQSLEYYKNSDGVSHYELVFL